MILHALHKNHFKKKYLGCQDRCSPELSERFSNSTTIWIWVKHLQEKEQFGVQFLQVFWECEGQPWTNHYVTLFFTPFQFNDFSCSQNCVERFLLWCKICISLFLFSIIVTLSLLFESKWTHTDISSIFQQYCSTTLGR